MAKIFEVDYRQGSLINKVTNELGTTVAGTLDKKAKGYALNVNSTATKDVVYTTGASANLGTIYSVNFWCNINSIGATDNAIICITESGSNNLRFYHRGGGTLGFYGQKAGSTVWNQTINNVFKVGRDQMITVTVNGTSLKTYVNGTLFNTTAITSVDASWKSVVYIGTVDGSANPFNGYIYKAQIYNHELSQQEIDKLTSEFQNAQPISKPKLGFEYPKPTDLSRLKDTGLVAAYNMQPQGNTLVDISGGGYNLAKTLGGSNTSKKGMTNTGKENWTSTPTISLDTDFSLSFRVLKKHTGTTLNTLFRTTNGTTTGIWVYLDSGVNGRLTIDNNVTPAHFNGALPVIGQEYTITLTYLNSSNTTNCYINGVFFATSTAYAPTSPRTSILRVLYSGGAGNDNGLSELQDLRVYNRILTIQEIKDYHNSFNDITLIEDFSDCPADNVTSVVPTGWEKISGAFKVGEHTMANSELVINGGFSSGSNWTTSGEATVGGGVARIYSSAGVYSSITQTVPFTVGKRYRVSIDVTRVDLSTAYVGIISGQNIGIISSTGKFISEFTALSSGTFEIKRNNGGAPTDVTIDNISVVEIPPLTTIQNGTKYLECVSPGTLAIPSQQAYGTWEFDWYKGADANRSDFIFMNDKIFDISAATGYYLSFTSSENIIFARDTSGSAIALYQSATSYITNNTWYRVRITRTTAGVFTTLIKGGSFTPTAGYDGWTLIAAASGSGANPVTDNNHTVSNYLFLDIDNGDRVANIKLIPYIKQ